MNPATIRLFQRAVHLWVLGYMLSALPLAEWLWEYPVSPPLPVPGFGGWLMNAFGTWLPGQLAIPGAGALILFSAYGVLREPPHWMAFITWVLFASLTQRVQLIFTYLGTGLHKFTGTAWLDGTAVGIVVTDPQFGPVWLAHVPRLVAVLTWGILALQFVLPAAVWWRPSRYVAIGIAVLFHLVTAAFIGIPQMGLAFIACWAIWLDSDVAARWESALRRARRGPA